jgi:large subunit ribosomal protein L2
MLFSTYKFKNKTLISRKKKNAGRNNRGRITVAHQGGGHSQLYRKINFKENLNSGTVLNIEYDPNRSAYIAKICFLKNKRKKYFYILSPQNLKILDKIENSTLELEKSKTKESLKQVGSFYSLNEFKIGDFIYNIETSPNKGGQLVRSAGTFAQILQKDNQYVTITLPSGEHRNIPLNCKACFGCVSNDNHQNVLIKKAGRSR